MTRVPFWIIIVILGLWSCGHSHDGAKYDHSDRYQILGIDVSAHNGEIDYGQVAGDGVEFVYIKATEGADFKDTKFIENLTRSQEAGLKAGAYHFFKFQTSGYLQGLNMLNSLNGRHLDLPIVIDFEEYGNVVPDSREEVVKRLKEMVSHLEGHGYRVVIYTNKNGVRRYIKGHFPNNDLWLCSLAEEPEDDWVMWQSTHSGKIKGIDGNVDLNLFNGGRDKWETWCSWQKNLPQ